MKYGKSIAALAALACAAFAMSAKAGGDLVKFPEDYAKGVLYTTVDRPDNKQYRELYAPAAAVEAAKKGEPCRTAPCSRWCNSPPSSTSRAIR